MGGGNHQSMMGRQSVDEMREYIHDTKLKQEDGQRRSMFKKDRDMIDQMQDIKKEKHVMRMAKD